MPRAGWRSLRATLTPPGCSSRTARSHCATLRSHAQQASEKALKALLVANGLPVPRTHSLAWLVALLPAVPQALREEELGELDPWAVEGHYAEEGNELTAGDAELLVAVADRTLTACRSLLDVMEHSEPRPDVAASPAGDSPANE